MKDVKHMVAQQLAEMFEAYLDERLCPFVPWGGITREVRGRADG